jgi:chromosomal replication initiator protein
VVDRIVTIPLLAQECGFWSELSASSGPAGAFVAGPENALATTVIRSCLDRDWGRYSPIVLVGPSGSGKSHLARGLADWWQKHFPVARVACLAATEFSHTFGAAMRGDRLSRWRRQMRELDLLVLEDIGQLNGKGPAQQELRHVLDALSERGALVVVTNRALPASLRLLLPGLRSRLSAGLAVPLSLPARDTRRILLRRFAADRGLQLAERATLSLADGLNVSVPALLAALSELAKAASTEGRPIDADRAREFLDQRNRAQAHTLREIAGLTAKQFGLKLSDLKSPLRRQPLVAARSMAMYLARHLTNDSLEQIGKFFGGRDHTTVLHGCRRTEELLERDLATRHALAELKKSLAGA